MFGFETVGRGMRAALGHGRDARHGPGLLRRSTRCTRGATRGRCSTSRCCASRPSRSRVCAGSLFRIGDRRHPVPAAADAAARLRPRRRRRAACITFASSAGAMVMKPVTQWALRWFGFRNVLVWNGVLSRRCCCGDRRRSAPSWPLAAIYAVLLTGGFFRSLQFTAYNTIAYADIPRARMSAATSLYSTHPAAFADARHLDRRGQRCSSRPASPATRCPRSPITARRSCSWAP